MVITLFSYKVNISAIFYWNPSWNGSFWSLYTYILYGDSNWCPFNTKKIVRAIKTCPIGIFGHELSSKLAIFWHKISIFSIFMYNNTPSVICHWKGMTMSIYNPLSLNLYDVPIIAQNFDDTSVLQCKLYLKVRLICLSLTKKVAPFFLQAFTEEVLVESGLN